jgi:predicted amidophosphoribosyltransferase
MPSVRCSCCRKDFWWYDNSKPYCRKCADKFKIKF